MPFDAFSQTMIAVQHRIYYVVLSLARFNLYANSYGYLASKKAKRNGFWYCEIAGITFFWIYFGLMLRSQPTWKMRLAYLLVSHIATSPVHVQVSGVGYVIRLG
jgi:delta8-fatty-acid desaturase